MKTAQLIGLWADRLRDMSATGLQYAENIYDRDRYKTLQDIAIEMFALVTGSEIDDFEPIRNTFFSRPTPTVVADAAIISDSGRMLLIRRADNGAWAMPGGYLEVGETAAEGAVREALEESGVHCTPAKLVGIYDSRICGSMSAGHLYMVTVLCTPSDGAPEEPSHAHEVLEAEWFSEANFPEDLSPGHDIRSRDAFRIWRNGGTAHLDI